MCGRYAITLPPEAVRAYFAYVETPNFPPRFNIAPTQPIPIVLAEPHSGGSRRHFQPRSLGFPAGLRQGPEGLPADHQRARRDARREAELPRGAEAAPLPRDRRRFLRVAQGAGRRGGKRPYLIRRVGGEPMGFAGLYETWSDPTGGEIDTACIVTTAANALAGRLHDRMPAILEPGDFSAWLDVDGVEFAKAAALLKPAPEAALELVEIGPSVNRVANDDPRVQTPVAAPIRAEGGATLF